MSRRLPMVSDAAPRGPVEPPPFARIGILGLGLVGGSLALACRRRWPTALIVGVDRNDVLEDAMRQHAIDVGADDLGMLRDVDAVVLCAPLDVCVRLLPDLQEVLAAEAVVTDVCSVKRPLIDVATRHLVPVHRFVAGHPFAGAARSGIAHATPDLFVGRPWFLVPPTEDAGRAAYEGVRALVEGIGARPHAIDAERHDRDLAVLSHVPQIVASVLMGVVGERVGAEALMLAGRGLRDTTRLASSDASVWQSVLQANHDALAPVLDEVIDHLIALRDDAGVERWGEICARAQRWRHVLEETTR